MISDLLRRKSLDEILAVSDDGHGPTLRRHLSVWALTALGIGAVIGAGIFSTVGTAAAGGADHLGGGPAIMLSFVLTAVACGFAGLCYAELSSMVPISGSAYTYSYATLGELAAWIIGWDLIIEYAVGNIAVAISWSGYFQELLRGFGIAWPPWLGIDYRSAAQAAVRVAEATAAGGDAVAELGASTVRMAQALAGAPHLVGVPIVFNLPAFLIVMGITLVLVRGIRESAGFNNWMVVLKLAIIGFFVVLGAFYVQPENWTPFAPNGFKGIASAAAIIFFAYIGFDAVSTAAEESRNPQRDMPRAILGSLAVCTLIYIVVAAVLTGMLPWNQLGTAEPLATAFSNLGMGWPALLISLGAVFATTSVLIVFQLGQPRIFFSMARDGLLPAWAARVHPRFRTPHVTTWITGIFVAVLGGLANIDEIVQLTNIGTLFAFVLVCFGVIVLRYTDPGRPRPFRVPGGAWLVPLAGAACCVFLMVWLPPASWWRFVGWLVIGAAIYAAYGWRTSVLGRRAGRPASNPPFMNLLGLGFALAGVGLFVIPHDAGIGELLREAIRAGVPGHGRAAVGGAMILAGVAALAIGALAGLRRAPGPR
ncbi:MAG: amino acid permease-associated protein [Acidobacteria bacterium]|nr:amino acid permease-associated protein [Acidobacteriota bacterium]